MKTVVQVKRNRLNVFVNQDQACFPVVSWGRNWMKHVESGTCGSLMDHSSAESGHTYIITPHLHLSGKRAVQRGTYHYLKTMSDTHFQN